MAGMSTYPFKCDLCGGVTELAPTYGDFKCQHCGQVYVYDECHRIELSEPQLQTLRDSRWIPVSERLPDVQVTVLLSRPPEHRQSRLRIMRLIDQGYEQYWADDIGYTSPINSYSHWMPLPEPPTD
jgi:predicted RNA-binding Zn-ribbon protein involved in translation (DUF1610 family)